MQRMHGLLVTCLLGTLSDSVMNVTECLALHRHRVTARRRPLPMTEQQSKLSLTLFWRPREGEAQRGLGISYDFHAPIIWTSATRIVLRNEK